MGVEQGSPNQFSEDEWLRAMRELGPDATAQEVAEFLGRLAALAPGSSEDLEVAA